MRRRTFLKLASGSAFGVLTGTSIAQSRVGLALKAASGISAATAGSLFEQGTDVSPIRPAFAGPVCAKGRVTPEIVDFCDGAGVSPLIFVPNQEENVTVYDDRKVEGLRSTKFNIENIGSASSFFATLDSSKNFTRQSFWLRFYIPPENHNISSFQFGLRDSTGSIHRYIVWHHTRNACRTGWIEVTLTPSNESNYQWNPPISWNLIDRILITIFRQNNQLPAYVLINGVRVWDGRLITPLYCCTFDDNYLDQYQAAKYAISKGVPISLFINKNYSDGWGVTRQAGMTLAQNQELAELGCVHFNHGKSHSPPRVVTEGHKPIEGFAMGSSGAKTEITVFDHGYNNGDSVLITGTTHYNTHSTAIDKVMADTFEITTAYVPEGPCGTVSRLTTVNDLWSNPNTPIESLIADIEENRQWMIENGLGFGSHIFGSPQEWWLDHHEQYLRPYMFGRPRQGLGMGAYGLLTMWDEHTEVRSACDTHLANAYKMLQNNVGTLLWTPGTYPPGALREWTDGGIYEVTNPEGTSENPSHTDWSYLRDRGIEDEGDSAIQIDVWHHYGEGGSSGALEGTLQDFKDYIDVVAAHIAAGRLRVVDLRQLYENYLYTTTPPDTIPGDIDGDGKVDIKDFKILAENWLKETENI